MAKEFFFWFLEEEKWEYKEHLMRLIPGNSNPPPHQATCFYSGELLLKMPF